ncbi:AI-2E family transporter [Cellulosilyticum sp. I15G10I2]|uniref:AI-2E family transporter n=1 Tax=Cellulosilyticum sp. I15G10I2 TaxID=1892843 RepID=UPI00085C4F42|nr:AI-2E family transporter [Cellulosilyticum sp. I15G10I2]
MRFEQNNKYFTISVYSILTSIAVILAALIIFNFYSIFVFLVDILRNLCRLLKPLIIGGIIAYLLDPVVEFYEKRCKNHNVHLIKINFLRFGRKRLHQKDSTPNEHKSKTSLRTIPTILTAFTIIAFLGLFVLVVSMNIRNVLGSAGVKNISVSINRYIAYFENMLAQMTNFTDRIPFFANSRSIVESIYGYINLIVARLSQKGFNFLTVLGTNVINIALAFVIAFYLLQDKRRVLLFINKVCETIFPEKTSKNIKLIGRDIDHVFSNYIRGQLIDALIIGILACVALTLIRMDFAIIIGIIAGIFNLIPYFGPVVGFVLAALIGLIDADPMKAIYGVLALFLIQQIDGWVIVPKVIGNSVKLHPVVVLLAILIGGKLFGLIGMLLGVPVAAFIRVIILRYMKDDFETKEEW